MKNISEPEQILKYFLVPDNTRIETNRIIVEGDVIVGNHSSIQYGISGDTVIIGEGVDVSGDIVACSDARIDMWSKMGSRVEVGRNAYLGEFVTIDGKLTVEGDLDVGKEVKIKGGFEAKGWIVVRNPVPVIMFLLLYIREMMRLGRGEEVEKAIEELFDDSEENQEPDGKEPGEKVLIIPEDAKMSPEAIEAGGEAVIGNNCYLIGTLRVQSVETGKGLTLKGSVFSEGNVTIGESSTVYGNLVSKGQIHIGRNSRVFGGIKADSVILHENARVDGTIKAPSGVSFLREAGEKPVLAEVNALGKVIIVEAEKQLVNVPEEGLMKAVDLVEIDSLIKVNPKAKNGFVPGMERKSARTRAFARTRRLAGSRSLKKRQETGEHQS
ncbi:polymer-forming cytoskeletal protein [Methanosarcina sp.]|uniref:polymer-forming cytoskeletal protein n=1 Tax=Methanosarcina sp. TaxID=2213 RepID=UPI002AB8D617|nr:polymer-forming cytoskeletal protein [Methanosarcina sp.]MDY9927634.1 polymer-forming cytoskeletal protein [Methanosarcina sp.]